MNPFALNREFCDFKSVLDAKKEYERATNTILSISGSKPLVDDGNISKTFVYERLLYTCKAGAERPSNSKGLRRSSTYKKGCPVKIRLALVKDKTNNKRTLKVLDINLRHENHNLDEATFKHYPENMRLDAEKLENVEKMVELGVKKHKLKVDLMSDGKTNVSLKYLHNIQTKILKRNQGSNDGDILQKLLERLKQIPNGIVRVVSNAENELVGIFFQDERMRQIFSKYPELMLFDGTYKMNNVDMPLLTQLCVDGNGETEIASIFITRSESYACVGAMVDIFQSTNPTWTETKVILTDKDFADRRIYFEKYPDAVLQICLWHALVTFNREITTTKRNITQKEREMALEIIQRIVYAESKEKYDAIYKELMDLKLEMVSEYFNNNWHNIYEEWTLFGRNAHANYLNSTNNRSESINQKFKVISNRHSNLLTFFENVFTTVSVLSSERNIRAIRMTMRVPRKRFEDEFLSKYNDLLTPFVFKKLEYQYELSSLIKFATVREESAITEKSNAIGHTVTEDHCTCMYFSSMQIPCRHLFQYWLTKELELFQPDMCAQRWTKSYYYKSHPAINSLQYIPPRPVTHVVRVKIPSEMQKYKKTATATKDLNNLMSTLPNSEFSYYYDKVEAVLAEIRNKPQSQRYGDGNQSSSVTENVPSSTRNVPDSSQQNPNGNQSLCTQGAPYWQQQTFTGQSMNDRFDNQPASAPVVPYCQQQTFTGQSMNDRFDNQPASAPVVPYWQQQTFIGQSMNEAVLTGNCVTQTMTRPSTAHIPKGQSQQNRFDNQPASAPVVPYWIRNEPQSQRYGDGNQSSSVTENVPSSTRNVPDSSQQNPNGNQSLCTQGAPYWQQQTFTGQSMNDRFDNQPASAPVVPYWQQQTFIGQSMNEAVLTGNCVTQTMTRPSTAHIPNGQSQQNRFDNQPASAPVVPYWQQQTFTGQNFLQSEVEHTTAMTEKYQIITLPPKNVPVGRPKGTGNTVIGTKRKLSAPSQSANSKKIKFFDRNLLEQGALISTWLTNWPKDRVGRKKIATSDIIQDHHTFNRLRHKEINLNCLKNYVDKKTLLYIGDEIDRLKKSPYTCRKCQKKLSGMQVMCFGCLDWYHVKCIALKPSVAKNIEYFCSDCSFTFSLFSILSWINIVLK